MFTKHLNLYCFNLIMSIKKNGTQGIEIALSSINFYGNELKITKWFLFNQEGLHPKGPLEDSVRKVLNMHKIALHLKKTNNYLPLIIGW